MNTMLDNWRRTVRDELDTEVKTVREAVTEARQNVRDNGVGLSLESLRENLGVGGNGGNGDGGVGQAPGRRARRERPVWEEARPWHARHRLAILTGLSMAFVVFGLLMLTGGHKADKAKPGVLYPDRLGRKASDVEMHVGDTHAVGDIALKVNSVDRSGDIELAPSKTNTEADNPVKEAGDGKTWVEVSVDIKNVAKANRTVGVGAFRVETANGQLLKSTNLPIEDRFVPSELVPGGTTSGTLLFEVPDETGDYLIFQPAVLGAARVVVSLDDN
jgi:Domain of unknown function (DUF4352)